MGTSTITRTAILFATLLPITSTFAEEKAAARFHLDSSKSFITEKTSVFAINKREVDPFGQPQDPNKKVVKPVRQEKKPEVKITKKEQQILIEKEIQKLGEKITVLGRSLIIDGVPYKRGSSITVEVKGKTFPLRVNSITRSKITFLDLTDKNIISLKIENGRVIKEDPEGPHRIPEGNNKSHKLD